MLVARAEYNYYPEYTEEQNPKKVIKKKKRVRAINKNMYITIAIILFITSLLILYRYAKITEANLEITKLEKEVVELQKIRQDLEGKLEGIKSTTTISEVAKSNLGMIYPENGQVVYVSVNNDSDVEFASRSFSEKLSKLLSNFSSLF
ncbi:cell division protein FtsL [Tissierella sp. Yu-01]|uniref:cell division protein FtsL n=1 Tax=Tissierella sp. Yu-01 TaxID=3035694 RepID=UPI00240CF604|nr:cell division protein FtsL [Tissierella sp. Yu-01]WFA09626.1 cell division protein FtsL [Tissierella sp. Yu-01]